MELVFLTPEWSLRIAPVYLNKGNINPCFEMANYEFLTESAHKHSDPLRLYRSLIIFSCFIFLCFMLAGTPCIISTLKTRRA